MYIYIYIYRERERERERERYKHFVRRPTIDTNASRACRHAAMMPQGARSDVTDNTLLSGETTRLPLLVQHTYYSKVARLMILLLLIITIIIIMIIIMIIQI